MDRWMDRQKDTETDRKTDRQTCIPTERKTDSKTYRQLDRKNNLLQASKVISISLLFSSSFSSSSKCLLFFALNFIISLTMMRNSCTSLLLVLSSSCFLCLP